MTGSREDDDAPDGGAHTLRGAGAGEQGWGAVEVNLSGEGAGRVGADLGAETLRPGAADGRAGGGWGDAGATVLLPGAAAALEEAAALDATPAALDATVGGLDATVDGGGDAQRAEEADAWGGLPARLPSAPRTTAAPGGRGEVVRRYADGVLTDSGGGVVQRADAAQRVVRLPYTAADVKMRIGDYDVLGELGRGGMGVVYRAYALRLGRSCALKVMRAGDQATEADILRFQNEAMLAARLNHPNIVQIFDSGEEGELFYFVMELVEGSSLDALIRDGSPEAVRAGLGVLAQVAEALDFAHRRGVVHRDIKPDNILIDANGDARITDFGIAKNTRDVESSLTVDGAAMGTPYYMPPEQANGELHHIGPLSDVYALGATMYHVVTGEPPFVAETAFAIMLEVVGSEPEAPSARSQRVRGRPVSLDVETICLKAMEKEAGRRYGSAQAMAEDLRAYLSGRPIQARPITQAERLRKLVRRNRAVLVGASVVLGVLMVMTVAFGSVVGFNMHRAGESLRAMDQAAALDQAATLERAIRVNMLQGRADVARELVQKLREDDQLNRLQVVRADRSFAYTDVKTREQVEARLNDPEVMAKIGRDHPELLERIETLKTLGFANIDDRRAPPGEFEFDRGAWGKMLRTEEPLTEVVEVDGERNLVVLKPIANSKACQICHGESSGSGGAYASNTVRAVLVIYRSQAAVEAQIRANQLATLGVGLATTCVFLLLLWIAGRLFGVRLRARTFGAQR